MSDEEPWSLKSPVDRSASLRRKADRRAARKAGATRVVRVLNLGAGVQSTALLLMDAMAHRWGRRAELESWLERDYPFDPFDFAIFADTMAEPMAVYEHLARLRAMDTAPILVGSRGDLAADLISGRNSTGENFYSIPAFTSAVEGVPDGMIRRQCTAEYKVVPVERAIRREIFGLKPGRPIPPDSRVVQSFGLSFEEGPRIARVRARVEATGWSDPEFPLAEFVLERRDCVAFLASIGVEAPRSACVFCPYRSNAEWRWLRDNEPAGWDRAVDFDRSIRSGAACSRGLDQKLYVHRSCLPLDVAPIDEPDRPMLGFAAECEGMCGS